MISGGLEAISFAASLSAMRLALDPKVGLIRSAEFMATFETEPPVFLCYADPCDTFALSDIEASNRGGACATTAERAFVRACGEAIERYCSSFFNFDEMIVASQRSLANRGIKCVPTSSVYSFADDQYAPGFPFDRVDSDSPVRWVPAVALASDDEVLVPASCVYVPYRFDRSVEPFTHMSISTGLACGPDLSFCVEKGILEILERDALMIVWHRRLPVPRIDVQSCRGISAELDTLLSADVLGGAVWHLNLLTLDVHIPIVSAILVSKEDPPRTSFGVAADIDPMTAVAKAMEEALLSRFLLNRSIEVLERRSVDWAPRTLRQHLLAHALSPDSRKALGFLTEAERLLTSEDFSNLFSGSKNYLADQLAAADLCAYHLDITSCDVADLGLRVARVIVPTAQPLDNDHYYPYLGGKRLRSVPAKLGYRPTCMFNADPHPFP